MGYFPFPHRKLRDREREAHCTFRGARLLLPPKKWTLLLADSEKNVIPPPDTHARASLGHFLYLFLHLHRYKYIHLGGIFEREFSDDGREKSVYNHSLCCILIDSTASHIEECFFGNLPSTRLVCNGR